MRIKDLNARKGKYLKFYFVLLFCLQLKKRFIRIKSCKTELEPNLFYDVVLIDTIQYCDIIVIAIKEFITNLVCLEDFFYKDWLRETFLGSK